MFAIIFVGCKENIKKYKDEHLLNEYVNKKNFIDEDFSLLFIRTKLLCVGCIPDHEIAINTVLNNDSLEKIFIIFDDVEYANFIDSLYRNNYNYMSIVDSPENLYPYGLHQVHPHLFTFVNKKLVKWQMFNNPILEENQK